VGAPAGGRRGPLTADQDRRQGPESDPLQHDPAQTSARALTDATTLAELPTGRLIWERIYGRPLTDPELKAIERNLFRFIDLLASVPSSTLIDHEWSTNNGDEAA